MLDESICRACRLKQAVPLDARYDFYGRNGGRFISEPRYGLGEYEWCLTGYTWIWSGGVPSHHCPYELEHMMKEQQRA